MYEIKNRDRLLSDLATAVRDLDPSTPIGCVEVTLHCPSGDAYDFGLQDALACIVDDLYWDERGDWSDANSVTVKRM